MRQRFNPHKNRGNNRFPKMHKSVREAELRAAIQSVEVIKKGHQSEEEEVIDTKKSQFTDFPISEKLLQNIEYKGYKLPTPIQKDAIPEILKGRDVIGIADTGTGKTAAFLIPLIEKVFQNKTERVLIIAPTRELAMQIKEELKAFSKSLGIQSVLCIGGMSINMQKSELKHSPHFVIGTPGRLKDLISEKVLNLSQYTNVVLDETDRMVDIGFISDIKYFISLLPSVRQSLFFSATVPPKVEEILRSFVRNPVTVAIKKKEAAQNIEQDVIRLEPGYKKIDKLHDLLASEGFDKVIIFGRTKWGVQKLAKELIRRGFRVGAIHGNKNQNQRQRVLQQFKNNEIQILLATDVASRGLDIPDVSHVINYDMPATMEDYTHRIGRTGRANKKGIALTFVE